MLIFAVYPTVYPNNLTKNQRQMITFFLRGDSIYVRVPLGKRNEKLVKAVGIKIPEKDKWDRQRNRINGRSAEIMRINSKLSRIEQEFGANVGRGFSIEKSIIKALNLRSKENRYLLDFFEEYAAGANDDTITKSNGKPLAATTKQNIGYALSKYREHVQFTDDLDVPAHDVYSAATQEERMLMKRSATDHAKKYLSFLIEEKLSPSTQRTYLGTLTVVIGWIARMYMIDLPMDVPSPSEKSDVVVLEPKQIDMVVEFFKKEYSNLRPPQKRAMEITLIILFATYRISDVRKLTADDIRKIETDGQTMYALPSVNTKTKAKTYAPIPKRLGDILLANHKKYGSIYHKGILGTYTGILMSIRSLFGMIPVLKDEKFIYHQPTSEGEFERVSKPIKAAIRPHILRASAITNMRVKGIPETLVKRLSGHTATSKAYARYEGVVKDHMEQEIRKYQSSLLGD